MPSPVLDGKQRRFLRALGHHLSPVVQVGTGGVTPEVERALDQALARHELVKVRVVGGGNDLAGMARGLADGTRSAHAQTLGKTLLFYRPREKKPSIALPAGASAGRTRGTTP